jgi:hypothetical protein
MAGYFLHSGFFPSFITHAMADCAFGHSAGTVTTYFYMSSSYLSTADDINVSFLNTGSNNQYLRVNSIIPIFSGTVRFRSSNGTPYCLVRGFVK